MGRRKYRIPPKKMYPFFSPQGRYSLTQICEWDSVEIPMTSNFPISTSEKQGKPQVSSELGRSIHRKTKKTHTHDSHGLYSLGTFVFMSSSSQDSYITWHHGPGHFFDNDSLTDVWTYYLGPVQTSKTLKTKKASPQTENHSGHEGQAEVYMKKTTPGTRKPTRF